MAEDRDAKFEELYAYYPAVVKLLLNLGFELEDARDLAQQAFLRVYEHMDAYRGESKLGYLQRTARNLAYNAQRDRHAAKRDHGKEVQPDEILEMADPRCPGPDTVLQSKQIVERVQRAIEQLNPKDQTIVRMRLAGYSLEEIAPGVGTTPSALKSRLNVIRKRLRDLLNEDLEGFGGSDDQ